MANRLKVGKAQAKALPAPKMTVEEIAERIRALESRLQAVEDKGKKQGG